MIFNTFAKAAAAYDTRPRAVEHALAQSDGYPAAVRDEYSAAVVLRKGGGCAAGVAELARHRDIYDLVMILEQLTPHVA